MLLLGQNAPIVKRALTAIVFFLQYIYHDLAPHESHFAQSGIAGGRGSCLTLSFTTSRRPGLAAPRAARRSGNTGILAWPTPTRKRECSLRRRLPRIAALSPCRSWARPSILRCFRNATAYALSWRLPRRILHPFHRKRPSHPRWKGRRSSL